MNLYDYDGRPLVGDLNDAQRAVQLVHQLCGVLPCPGSGCQRVDGFHHALDSLLERLRAVHGEPRRDHHDGHSEPAEDGRVAAKKRSGDR